MKQTAQWPTPFKVKSPRKRTNPPPLAAKRRDLPTSPFSFPTLLPATTVFLLFPILTSCQGALHIMVPSAWSAVPSAQA